jgi:predicted transcriptional regulator
MVSRNEVEEFIRATFRSVWALEILCLLRKNRERSLTSREMVEVLRASDFVVAQSLDNLASMGLVVRDPDGSARYCPADRRADQLVGDTEQLYARSPNAVRRIIATSINPGLTAFADAFRLRRDDQ